MLAGAASFAPATTTVAVATDTTAIVSNDDLSKLKATTTADIVKEYFKDTPIMADVAWCESRLRQFDKDGEVFRGKVNSNDVGIMQINTDYHLEKSKALGLNIFSLEGNLAYAKHLFEEEGTAPWNSSSKCWKGKSNLVAIRK